MRGVVESWDAQRGRGWIRPLIEAERAARLNVKPETKIEVERRVLSPSAAGALKPGQQVGFVYKAPEKPELPGRAEAVVVIS
jgi:hypothetical protein